METKKTCPMGHECERAEGGTLYRCRWFVTLRGKDPQSEKEYDEQGCAVEWMPIMLVENAQRTRGMTAATESFRNEMVKGQEAFNALLAGAARQAQQIRKARYEGENRGLISKVKAGLLGR